jgi:hypothetical protein
MSVLPTAESQKQQAVQRSAQASWTQLLLLIISDLVDADDTLHHEAHRKGAGKGGSMPDAASCEGSVAERLTATIDSIDFSCEGCTSVP